MGQLVCHHHPHLVAAVALEQRVEQDHSLGRAESGHVGVDASGPPAGIHLEYLPHAHPGGLGQLQDVRAHGTRRERGEPVEHRIQNHGSQRAQCRRHPHRPGGRR